MADEDLSLDRRSPTWHFPGIRLLGAIRLAFDSRKLVVAALGLVLLRIGWASLDALLPASAAVTPEVFGPAAFEAAASGAGGLRASTVIEALHLRLVEPVRLLTVPLFALIDPGSDWSKMVHALLGLVWLIVVWAICGGAITRIALVQIARMHQAGIGDGLRFAIRSARPLVLTPLCPLIGMAFCSVIVAGFGLLYRLPTVGPAVAGVLLVIPLGFGLIMTMLVAGLVAGWPMLQAAVASGADDALDALSRSFSYLNQRLGLFAASITVVWVGGIVGLLIVEAFAEVVIHMTQWGLSLTAPVELTMVLFGRTEGPTGGVAAATHAFWLGCVRLLARAWVYSYFWTAASFVYLLLRHDVDGTPWTEIDPPGAPSPIAPDSSFEASSASPPEIAPPAPE